MSDRLRRLMPVAMVVCALVVVARPVSAQFVQQGPKLVSPAGGRTYLGTAVALSADGKTAIAGASFAALVFVRIAGTWQQGNWLMGGGNVGAAQQGASVALSADGNTVIVGGPSDNQDRRAAHGEIGATIDRSRRAPDDRAAQEAMTQDTRTKTVASPAGFERLWGREVRRLVRLVA